MAVYFVQAIDGGPIKIGTSENVDVRVKDLESVYHRPLTVLATRPGGYEEERAIHEQFSHLRIGYTEQFRPDPELLAFIGDPPVIKAMESRMARNGPVGKRGPKPNPEGRRGTVIAVRCWPRYKLWAEQFAGRRKMTPSQLVEIALLQMAEREGFKAPPER